MDTSRVVPAARVRFTLITFMQQRRVKQADIIRASGLNRSTVQRLLEGENELITPKTERRLRNAMMAINDGTYVPSSYRIGEKVRLPHPRDRAYCVWGHPFTPNNTRVTKDGKRVCRVCDAARRKKWRTLAKARGA